MPYIKQEDREDAPLRLATPGELNFAITGLLKAYLRTHGKSYTTMNAMIGALDAAKLEFYRRVVVPYENDKMLTNGDVYTPHS